MTSGSPLELPSREVLEAATLEWLESMRTRSAVTGPLASYGDDLGLTVGVSAEIDGDRSREGVFLQVGELTIDRLEVGDDGFVDLDAEIVFPPDEIDDPATIAPGRARGEVRLGLGPVYFAADESGLRLVDYTRGSLRMSAVWCTHPQGGVARAGLTLQPLAITSELHGAGRILLRVENALDREVVLRVDPPAPRRGLFKRQPPVAVGAPAAGIPIRAGGNTHLATLTRKARQTGLGIFVFDAADRSPVTTLAAEIRLPARHPGEHGAWCAE